MRYPIERLNLTPPGQTMRTRTADFMDGAFPSWMTVTGTSAVASPATTVGYAQTQTSGADANVAQFQSDLAVALGAIEAVLLEVEGFTLTEHNPVADIALRIQQSASTPGVYAIQRSTETFMRLGISGDAVGAETPTEWDVRGGRQAANNTPKNFGLLLQCRTKEMFLLDGSRRVLGYRDLASGFATATDVRPRLSIQARSATVKTMRIKQFRQTVWVN